MGSILNAIGRTDFDELNSGLIRSWEEFERERRNSGKLFVFGNGRGAEYFLINFNGAADAIADNNPDLQNTLISGYYPDEICDKVKCKHICSVDLLAGEEIKDALIMIASLNHFKEIAKELSGLGYEKIFSLTVMEKIRYDAGYHIDDDITGYYKKEYRDTPIDPNKIIFYSMGGYSGHCRAIAEELYKRNKGLDIVWVVNSFTVNVSFGFRMVKNSVQGSMIKEMSTAGFWIFDDRVPGYIEKKEGQIYIQTKHWAGITLKSFGAAVARFRGDRDNLRQWLYDRDLIDYILTGSDFDDETCRKCFEYEGKLVRVGSPRSDVLQNRESVKAKVKEKYGVDNETKILLFAPTFRITDTKKNTTAKSIPVPDMLRVKEALDKATGSEWTVFFRLHPRMKGLIENKYDDICIDVSDHFDSEELVASCDAMITDYSSIMFEPAFIGIPVFLYAPDRDDYIDKDRGLLMDYNDLPFPISTTGEMLIRQIIELDTGEYEKKVRQFLEHYGICEDGRATERAVDLIEGLMAERKGSE